MADLEDRLAVVTGGASGIGEACVRDLAAHGARVVVADLNVELAKSVAASVPRATYARVDVTKHADVEALAESLGPVDIVITSAGILQQPLPPESLSMESWDNVIAVDQRGVYVTCLAFGKRMALRGSGNIVNIASIAGMTASPLHAYSPAKAAVISITKSLAAEWGRSGVRVNAVAPGFVLTPAMQAAIDAGQRNPARLIEPTALGRLVGADEVAHACTFLASDLASGITGTTLTVDAGWLVGSGLSTFGGVRPSRVVGQSSGGVMKK